MSNGFTLRSPAFDPAESTFVSVFVRRGIRRFWHECDCLSDMGVAVPQIEVQIGGEAGGE